MVQDNGLDLPVQWSELTATRQRQLQCGNVTELPTSSDIEHELSHLISQLSVISTV